MSKTVDIPYDCGDKVWIMRDNKPECVEVLRVDRILETVPIHRFILSDPAANDFYEEYEISPTKEALMKKVFEL